MVFTNLMSTGQNIAALYGAPVKTSTPLPVIMFSHGVVGMRTTYSAVCCDLASHGYLVAAVEHRWGVTYTHTCTHIHAHAHTHTHNSLQYAKLCFKF